MSKIGIIFTDIDGTLVFLKDSHSIRRLHDLEGDLVRVADTMDKEHDAYESVTRNTVGYLSVRTKRLCDELRKAYEIVAVTGAQYSSFLSRKIDFCDSVIVETGGAVFENGARDTEWDRYLSNELLSLNQFKDKLKDRGWEIDTAGRGASLRIRAGSNPNRDLRQLEQSLLFHDLQMTHNLGHVDIMPRKAGKGNAVEYLMRKKGYHVNQSFGIGDDINDVDFLSRTGQSFVLQSGVPEILREAEKYKWRISKKGCFDGITEILQAILDYKKQ